VEKIKNQTGISPTPTSCRSDLINTNMYALTMWDRETQKQVFQIILDERLFSSGYELKATKVGDSPFSLS